MNIVVFANKPEEMQIVRAALDEQTRFRMRVIILSTISLSPQFIPFKTSCMRPFCSKEMVADGENDVMLMNTEIAVASQFSSVNFMKLLYAFDSIKVSNKKMFCFAVSSLSSQRAEWTHFLLSLLSL